MTGTPAPITLPCGCFLNPTIRALRISPCHADSPNLAAMIREATTRGKPIETQELP